MIENTNSSIVYVADGNTNTWNIPFEYKDANDITIVIQTKSGTNEITSNFEINKQTNKVIYPTVESGLAFLTNNDKILIERNVKIDQLEDSSLVKFEDNDIEREFDKLTMISQDIKRETNLSVKYSPFYTGDKLTANEFVDKVKDYSDNAKESAITAANQATIAQNHANQAYLNRLETIEQATVATTKAQEAKTSETNAYNSKVDAKNSEEEAKAVLASASKLLQEEGQKVIEELKGEIKIPGYSMIVYEVGIASGAYDGSLRKFPAKEPFASNSTYVMVNGTWQQRDFEYKEDVDGLGITFEYDLLLGDKVYVMTSAGFFEKKDIETFAEAINKHNKSTESHSDIRESIKNAGYEDTSVVELGRYGLKENQIGNFAISFDKEPINVFLRFSDTNRKMWINCSHSSAGIEKKAENVYALYFNINSDDFKEQNILLPPFDVQYVIRYKKVTSSTGDVANYNDLENKPQINNVELSGNKTLDQLGIASKTSMENVEELLTDKITIEDAQNLLDSTLTQVAKSGDYNDLINKPTIPEEYILPKASDTTLGGIKVGNNLTIDEDGTLNAQAGGAGTSNYNDLTNKPTINNATIQGDLSLSDIGIDLSTLALKTEIPTTTSQLTNTSGYITRNETATSSDYGTIKVVYDSSTKTLNIVN